MPIPLLIPLIASACAALGIGKGAHGAKKMVDASKTIKEAQERDKRNINRLESANKSACYKMDDLGSLELETLKSFQRFSKAFEQIKNRPAFDEIDLEEYSIPRFNKAQLEEASVGASVLLGGTVGAGLGTLGGMAASGATTAAVMAFGTASTGTAISTLSGVAATNATLAALGGGSLAAGGGGMAVGSMVLGGATLGVGLLVGGIIFSIAGSSVKKKADKAYSQMQDNERKINSIIDYLSELESAAVDYTNTLCSVKRIYMENLCSLESLVNKGICDWRSMTYSQKLTIENTVLLVGLLYNMCKVKLVLKNDSDTDINAVNYPDITAATEQANKVRAKVQEV